jgi:hypothetical protein
MSLIKLIEAVKNGEINSVENLLNCGEEIDQKDDYGWTALNWAAGKGFTAIIEKLIAEGADITNAGRDNRTPFQIALAAAHEESASVLRHAEQKACANFKTATRPYCKAYVLTELRQFSGWKELASDLATDTIVFVHQDLSVTRSMFHGKDIIFDNLTTAWQNFCENQLAFTVPSDLDLAMEFAANRPF